MRAKISRVLFGLAVAACAAVMTTAAWAQHREFGERHAEERYNSPHWVYDTHHNLNHYYPVRGEIVAALPPAAVSLDFRGGHYFFQGGVFFRPSGARFAVTAPPFGVVVPVLPPAYATVWAAGVPYYYANDVYYTPAPGGYLVAAPPPGIEEGPPTVAQAPAGSAPPQAASPPAPVVYPRSNQTPALTAADQSACNEWATTQEKANDPTAYQRAFAACMDGRGYSVR